MRLEMSDSRLQGARRSCGCTSDGEGCQCHSAESSPFQLLAESVTFSVMLFFVFPAPVVFTSWTGWVMIWQPSTLLHSLYQHYQTWATWPVCLGFPSSCPAPRLGAALYLRSQPHSTFHLFPSPSFTKELSFLFFSSHLKYLGVIKLSVHRGELHTPKIPVHSLFLHKVTSPLQISTWKRGLTHPPSMLWV